LLDMQSNNFNLNYDIYSFYFTKKNINAQK
jgi:hypothetical protein